MGYWIALGIVVITIIAVIIAVMRMELNVTESLSNVKDLEENFENSSKYINTNMNYLKEQVEYQKNYATDMQARVSVGMDKVTVLEKEVGEFQKYVGVWNDNKEEYGRAAYETGRDYVKEEAPRRWNRLKEISKRTVDKQKTRYSKGEDA